MAESRTPGGIELQSLTLQTSARKTQGLPPLDLSHVFTEVHIYEDLYSNFIVGNVIIKDSNNLIKTAEILGHEELKIKFKGQNVLQFPSSNSDWFDMSFYVYSVGDRLLVGPRVQTYSLNFISKFAIANNLVKISKAYKGNIPTIVEQVSEEWLGIDCFADVNSPTAFHCVIPYWSPMQTLNWLAERCVGVTQDGQVADCLVFPDRFTEGIQMASLSDLKSQGPKTLDTTGPDGTTLYFQPAGTGKQFSPSKQRSIENYTIQTSFDILENTRQGAYAGQMVTHDIVRKKITHHPSYRQDLQFHQQTSLGQFNSLPSSGSAGEGWIFPSFAYSSYNVQSKHAHLYGDAVPPIHVEVPEAWVLRRRSQLQMMKTFNVGIQMPGDSNFQIGEVVRWRKFPSPEAQETKLEPPMDKSLSGDFLITAIHHMLTPGTYYTLIDLSKDSFDREMT